MCWINVMFVSRLYIVPKHHVRENVLIPMTLCHVSAFIFICLVGYVRLCVCVCLCVCLFVYLFCSLSRHTQTHTHTHTHIHTHTHTHTVAASVLLIFRGCRQMPASCGYWISISGPRSAAPPHPAPLCPAPSRPTVS